MQLLEASAHEPWHCICTQHSSCRQRLHQRIADADAARHGACRQEGMTSVLAAGGLLEGLARGTAALAPASPACQALSHILTQVCTRSQASMTPHMRDFCTEDPVINHSADNMAEAAINAILQPSSGPPPLQALQTGSAIQQAAAAIACCQTWQVSATTPGRTAQSSTSQLLLHNPAVWAEPHHRLSSCHMLSFTPSAWQHCMSVLGPVMLLGTMAP